MPVPQSKQNASNDLKVVNLSNHPLSPDHINLLAKGMSFSSTSAMDEFTVYKDITLFLRKVFLRSLYEREGGTSTVNTILDSDDQKVLDILNLLLEENSEHGEEFHTPTKCIVDLKIKSQKMPPLSKNRWLSLFLEMVQSDLEKVKWHKRGTDNLTKGERNALDDLKKRKNIVIKNSDKGGNVVVLDDTHYEKKAKKLLSDDTTYCRQDHNAFPTVIQELNRKLTFAKDEGLLTMREFQYLSVQEYNIPTFT